MQMSTVDKKPYQAKTPNKEGFIGYTAEENKTWQTLYSRQSQIVKNRACDEFVQGLHCLGITAARIPQCQEVNAAFQRSTGWRVQPVDAIIPHDFFFELLAKRIFPAAAFIRRPEDLDYLQEPDIFHEIFGHCPLLTEPFYADFMQKYGELALKACPADREYLARLYWFTIEFGLIKTLKGLRVYGAGILSSKTETVYALESPAPERRPLNDGLLALQTLYDIDRLQPIYYVIDSYAALYDLLRNDIMGLIHRAQDLQVHCSNE